MPPPGLPTGDDALRQAGHFQGLLMQELLLNARFHQQSMSTGTLEQNERSAVCSPVLQPADFGFALGTPSFSFLRLQV